MSIRSGGGWLGLAVLGQKCDFWKVLRLARNPSKKMRLDESFRMVQSACQSVAYIKSYGQKTKVIKILLSYLNSPDPPPPPLKTPILIHSK